MKSRETQSEMLLQHWANYLKSNPLIIQQLLQDFSPKFLVRIFETSAIDYPIFRMHLCQQLALDFFENLFAMDKKQAVLESLSLTTEHYEVLESVVPELEERWMRMSS